MDVLRKWGVIAGGILLALIGLYLTMYETMPALTGDVLSRAIITGGDPAFLGFLRWMGLLMVVRGIYTIVQGAVGYPHVAGRASMDIVSELFNLTGIPLLRWLKDRVEVIPIISFRDGQVVINQPHGQALPFLRAYCVLAIVGITIGVILALTKIAIREGFFIVIPFRKSHQTTDQGGTDVGSPRPG